MPKFELKMPKMGESITEGTIINWLINEGDTFEEGDIILEVATDKVDNEVPAPASGTMVQTKFEPKDVVRVGDTDVGTGNSARAGYGGAKTDATGGAADWGGTGRSAECLLAAVGAGEFALFWRAAGNEAAAGGASG